MKVALVEMTSLPELNVNLKTIVKAIVKTAVKAIVNADVKAIV